MNNLSICGAGALVDSLNMNNHVLSLTSPMQSTAASNLSNSTGSPISSYGVNASSNVNNVTNSNLNTLPSIDESKTNLIINYLPQAMTQEDLRNLFSSIGELESCKLIRDKLTGQSLGYGFVNYVKACDAEKAIQSLNGLRMQQKTIKVSFARPSTPLIKDANLYVSGLPKSMTQEDLQRIFQPFGRIITSRILVDPSTGMSRGVGFVRYDKRPEAENAITSLNGSVPSGAKDAITVKFANNPSQKNQQVLQTLYAAASPTRRLATPASGPVYHQARNFRTGVNDLLSNVNMGLGVKRASPYPDVRGASLVAASNIQSATPTLHLAPTATDYALTAPSILSGLTTLDPLCGLQGVTAYPTALQVPAPASAVALPRALPTSYTQLIPAADLNYAALTGMTPLPQVPIQCTTTRSTAVAVASPNEAPSASLNVIASLPSSSLSSFSSSTVADGMTTTENSVAITTTTSSMPSTSWYSPLSPELLSTMGMTNVAVSAASSTVIGQTPNFGICIFVYNLAPETDESILWQLFGPFGAVTSVKVIRDYQTQKCKGYGFVTMTNYEEAFLAVCSLNGYKLGDRVLQVSFKTARQVKFMN